MAVYNMSLDAYEVKEKQWIPGTGGRDDCETEANRLEKLKVILNTEPILQFQHTDPFY